ncbi:response regulator transcription factor [Isobaculum melis]|uniref:Two-component system, OmpR family, response regulator VanR n=1 Tax=Isobaculum melis TaxID=142588 RepID=A0A1H9TR15_9LACT|nr:response regulator transcription factor [Isobaculum melis]SER99592.1 two-component system, OmpR family, response regulator VanR [Isobaculum melis]
MSYHILVVEDDLSIQKAICTFLVKDGYTVTAAKDGEEAISLFEQETFHLILLDMMLPKKNGEEVLQEIRQVSPQQPVLIISALDDEFIQIDAYTKRIEDYVVKPFSMNILLFKINAILNRIYDNQNQSIVIGSVQLFVQQYEVTLNGEKIELTPKEFEILQAMFLNVGKVYSREELLTVVWGYDFLGDSRTIDVHVKNIRRKLGNDVIKTIKGIGYKVEKL